MRPGGPMDYEYKCVAAPEKARRRRGAKTRTARVAGAMEDILKAEAVDGWEYQRTDLIPVEEKSGIFSRAHEVHRAVMVFRRAKAASVARPAFAADAVQPQSAPAVHVVPAARPPSAEPVQMQEVPRPAASEADGDFKLAADRERATAPAAQPLRAPNGLG